MGSPLGHLKFLVLAHILIKGGICCIDITFFDSKSLDKSLYDSMTVEDNSCKYNFTLLEIPPNHSHRV